MDEEKRVNEQYKAYLVRAAGGGSQAMDVKLWFTTMTGKPIFRDRFGRLSLDFGYDKDDPTFGQASMLQFKLTYL